MNEDTGHVDRSRVMVLLNSDEMRLARLDAFLATAIRGVIRLTTGRYTTIFTLVCLCGEAHLRTGPRTLGVTGRRLDSTKLHLVNSEVTMTIRIVDWRQFRVVLEGIVTSRLVTGCMLASSLRPMIKTRAFEASETAASVLVTILGRRKLISEIMIMRATAIELMAAIRLVSRQATVSMMAIVDVLLIEIVGLMAMSMRSFAMFVIMVIMALLDTIFVVMMALVVMIIPVIHMVMVQMAACTMVSIQMRMLCEDKAYYRSRSEPSETDGLTCHGI